MASPSRSGSAASRMSSAFFADVLISATMAFFLAWMTKEGWSPWSRSTPSLFSGRSRKCPMQAFTVKPLPRYFWMALALAGDSTMTSVFDINSPQGVASWRT